MDAPQKIKERTAGRGSNIILGLYSEELEAESQRDICTTLFTAAFFTTARRGQQAHVASG